jgi:hypothetical protein
MIPPQTSSSEAFALHLEIACEDFEILQDLLVGHLQVVAPEQKKGIVPSEEDRRRSFRAQRASGAISMALAKSFVFNANRANRICFKNKGSLAPGREERELFLKATQPLSAVRDVNEHGFDGDKRSEKNRPSMHDQGGGALDETSMVSNGPKSVLMGALNLYDVYVAVNRMKSIAGYNALFLKKQNQGAASKQPTLDETSGSVSSG